MWNLNLNLLLPGPQINIFYFFLMCFVKITKAFFFFVEGDRRHLQKREGCLCQCTLTNSQYLSSENCSEFLFMFMLFLMILFKRKWQLSMYYESLIFSDFSKLSNEFNYLKSHAIFKTYNSPAIDKALNLFDNLKCYVSHPCNSCINFVWILFFYSFTSSKYFKIHLRIRFSLF